MRKFIGLLAFCFLSTCAAEPALASQCASTLAAVEVMQEADVRPLIVRGPAMAPLVKLAADAGSTGMEHARFVAILFTADGAALFFGNATAVCGPMLIPEETVNQLLRKS